MRGSVPYAAHTSLMRAMHASLPAAWFHLARAIRKAPHSSPSSAHMASSYSRCFSLTPANGPSRSCTEQRDEHCGRQPFAHRHMKGGAMLLLLLQAASSKLTFL